MTPHAGAGRVVALGADAHGRAIANSGGVRGRSDAKRTLGHGGDRRNSPQPATQVPDARGQPVHQRHQRMWSCSLGKQEERTRTCFGALLTSRQHNCDHGQVQKRSEGRVPQNHVSMIKRLSLSRRSLPQLTWYRCSSLPLVRSTRSWNGRPESAARELVVARGRARARPAASGRVHRRRAATSPRQLESSRLDLSFCPRTRLQPSSGRFQTAVNKFKLYTLANVWTCTKHATSAKARQQWACFGPCSDASSRSARDRATASPPACL